MFITVAATRRVEGIAMPWSGGSKLFANRVNAILIAAIVGIVALGVWLGGPGSDRSTEESTDRRPAARATPDGSRSVTRGELQAGEQWVGGIKRPATDVASSADPIAVGEDGSRGASESEPKPQVPAGYGATPPVKPDANPQVAKVAAAIRNRAADPVAYGRAVSTGARPEPFDTQKYVEDEAYRNAYLGSPEPGRVFAPAQPGEGVPRIARVGAYFTPAVQSEPVKLRVRAVAGAPVTFTSFDLGKFENELTTITVAADDKGVAEATFVAPPGTIADTNILAASPMASGQVKFIVHTRLPDQPTE